MTKKNIDTKIVRVEMQDTEVFDGESLLQTFYLLDPDMDKLNEIKKDVYNFEFSKKKDSSQKFRIFFSLFSLFQWFSNFQKFAEKLRKNWGRFPKFEKIFSSKIGKFFYVF